MDSTELIVYIFSNVQNSKQLCSRPQMGCISSGKLFILNATSFCNFCG